MISQLHSSLRVLTQPDEAAAAAVRQRAESVLRPTGALRRFDEIAEHLAAWQSTRSPTVTSPAVLIFAGDHGVARGGVSGYPSQITAAMLSAVRQGKATVSVLARATGASLEAIDVGVGRPTGDIRVEAALSTERFDEIASIAFDAVDRVVESGADLLVLGELGIGNTTIAAALTAAMLGGPINPWVGRGTGVDNDGLSRKRAAVAEAVERVSGVDDPIELLREIGGSEQVGMAAACTRARHHRLPVVLDGYAATAAVLPLHMAQPGALDHCIIGHVSAEPGHRRLIDALKKEPLLDLDMRLGEGSGALAAVPLIAMACATVTDVATFDEWFG